MISTLLLGGIVVGYTAGGLTPTPWTSGASVVEATPSEAPQRQIQIQPVTEEDNVRGSTNPIITLVEYSDFECPYCKSFHETMKSIIADYGDSVQWVYRDLPIDSIHSKARTEAEAAECAGKQGKFWEMADAIFAVTPSNDGLDLALLPELAREIGVDMDEYSQCVEERQTQQRVEDNIRDAAQAGATGTPFNVVMAEGELIPAAGALSKAQLVQFIEGVLSRAEAQ